MKISEEFQEFLESETSGTGDVITELIVKVVGDDHEAEIVLEQYGKDLFMECMRLARNVIISFEEDADSAERMFTHEYLGKWVPGGGEGWEEKNSSIRQLAPFIFENMNFNERAELTGVMRRAFIRISEEYVNGAKENVK